MLWVIHLIKMKLTERMVLETLLDQERKKKIRSIIVKFKSWKVRFAFHKTRLKDYSNGRKKPGFISFKVSLDLTKRRYS